MSDTPAAPTTPLDALVAALYDDRCIQPPQTDHAEHVITALLRSGYRIATRSTPAEALDAQTEALLNALAERNIYSRGDLEDYLLDKELTGAD